MATDRRPPEDLQEAVAATLRRLRGEQGDSVTEPERTEPQLTRPDVAPAPAGATGTGPRLGDRDRGEPDLLSASGVEPQISAPPGDRLAAVRSARAAYAAEPERPRSHVVLYALSAAALIVIVGAAWWAYGAFTAPPKKGQVPTIAADQTPEKVPPTDQSASNDTMDDKTVYDQISPGAAPAPKSEVLLAPPETPLTPPAPAAPAPTAADAAGGQSGTQGANQQTTNQSGTPTASQPAPAAAGTAPAASGNAGGGLTETLLVPTLVPTTPTSPAAAAGGGSSSAAVAAAGASKPAAPAVSAASGSNLTLAAPPPPPAPQPTEGGAVVATTGTQSTAPAATVAPNVGQTKVVSSNYRIQLAALKTEAGAKMTWKRLQKKNKDLLGKLSLHVERVDLGAKGIYFRVMAGPFAEKAAAAAICSKLTATGQQCMVKP